ncbi:proline--tRNA ligase [Candidatus Gracilibacteria bacterium]|nr:proline--tRNA ligase [Candidatus Gracilibacteria bacterium]MCF7819439.1 proline--tRNA ligase [Candidatus Gracilibacteria bacterium]
MKYSHLFVRTQKESPAEEDSKNAELLLRAGFIHKEMAGVYSYLPLGLKVINKITQIVREEMNQAGAVELLMPVLAPKENWEQTCRWDSMDVLYKLEASSGKEVALSPTHEEIVTPLVRDFCRSHKDFPTCVYQVQSKFRNEPRAKSGLLRAREFLMKDAYSFHTSQEDFESYYEVQKKAYERIYERLGLGDRTYYVAASGGDFSKHSHEFQTRCKTGEDLVFRVPKTGECFNKEIAPSKAPSVSYSDPEELPRKDVQGEGIIGVEELSQFLDISVEKTTKTLLFETDTGEVIAASVRGNYDVNELKLKEVAGCKTLQLASAEVVEHVTGAKVGYAGILDLPKNIRVFMDDSLQGRKNFEMGANKTDYHTININFGRDIPEPDQFYDIKIAREGDICPQTGEVYETFHAIEVGNIFPLATKFSSAFHFTFTDENGKENPVIMGCYGIGISRIMGSIVEIFHDEKGMLWPSPVTPFQVYLAAIGKEESIYDEAETLYHELQKNSIEVLYDDRRDKKIGPGQKFADHELMGLPCRLVLSPRTFETQEVEFVDRKTGEMKKIKRDEILSFVKKFLNE